MHVPRYVHIEIYRLTLHACTNIPLSSARLLTSFQQPQLFLLIFRIMPGAGFEPGDVWTLLLGFVLFIIPLSHQGWMFEIDLRFLLRTFFRTFTFVICLIELVLQEKLPSVTDICAIARRMVSRYLWSLHVTFSVTWKSCEKIVVPVNLKSKN